MSFKFSEESQKNFVFRYLVFLSQLTLRCYEVGPFWRPKKPTNNERKPKTLKKTTVKDRPDDNFLKIAN